MTHEHDPLLEKLRELRELPTLDSDEGRAEGLRRLARAELSRTAARSERGRRWSALWSSVLEPMMVAAVILIYAGWGLSTTVGLLQEAEVAPVATLAMAHPRAN